MREKKRYKRISVTEEVYNRLVKDKEQFQKSIGGGKWSISDTIREYIKIIDLIAEYQSYVLDFSKEVADPIIKDVLEGIKDE